MAISKGNKWFHLRGVVLDFGSFDIQKLENKIKYSIARLPKTNTCTISQMYLYKQQSRLALNNSIL